MTDIQQHHELALKKFLEADSALREQLEHLNPLAAQARGETMEQYRAERLHEAFEAEAERAGLFAWELTLKLTTATPEEFESQRMDVHKEVAEMAHMDWASYCELNGLKAT